MKKHFRLMSILLITLVVAMMSGCGAKGPSDTQGQTDKKPVYLTWATGGTAGTFYGVAGGISKVVKEKNPWLDISIQTGGTSENNRFVGQGDAQLGFTTADCAYFAHVGQREFKQSYPDLRAVISGPLMYQHIFVRADSSIKTINDLKGKRVSIGAPGTLTEIMAKEIFEAYGIQNEVKTERISLSEAVEALKDKRIDAGFHFASPPVPGLLDLATTTGIRLIPIDQAELEKILKKNPTWAPGEMVKGTYQDQNETVNAIASTNIIIVNQSVDPEAVYLITKTIIENTDSIAEVHPSAKEWNKEAATNGAKYIKIPFHPGAEKYLKEIGALK
ncbi:TAXI family TRAP transporter solute-binding subunit [Desulforamulus aeronauticus]|uniref:TRAP transporter solute receptor, TAXI family n=1 Tax=Desulforamulus aeronauticus DSM 10349 TaxID=1121421 RepID=A0A1M6NHI1_9FIRM|nr:TAXI family TRAP transporter solute-binding subunit [Desulforamulus aeronauticus]SHJ95074.1 hypothetical protein SAMN02745123_00132 [Desulforamulus aeronauticus DSM 10349]